MEILSNDGYDDMPSLMNSDKEMTSDEEINNNDENETDTGDESFNNDSDKDCEIKSREYEFSHMIAIKVNDREIIDMMRDISDQHGINSENNKIITRAHVTVAIFKLNETSKSNLFEALRDELK